jgi:hypothetical protein
VTVHESTNRGGSKIFLVCQPVHRPESFCRFSVGFLGLREPITCRKLAAFDGHRQNGPIDNWIGRCVLKLRCR